MEFIIGGFLLENLNMPNIYLGNKAPEDDSSPFLGARKVMTKLTVIYPVDNKRQQVSVKVNAFEYNGEIYISGKTTSFLDKVKAYYWHKFNKPLKEEEIFEDLKRLYCVIIKKVPDNLTSKELYNIIIKKTSQKEYLNIYEMLDDIYENYLFKSV